MRWNLKSPGNFPAQWHSLLTQGEGRFYLGYARTAGEARALADRFRHFRFCLRAFPGYAASAVERDFSIKLKTKQNEEGFFELWVEVLKPFDFSAVRSVLEER